MTCTYILKNYRSSEVLILSDIRPFRNVMFYNVLTSQGSSFCNSARLNFQAFALRDIQCRLKMLHSLNFSRRILSLSLGLSERRRRLGVIIVLLWQFCFVWSKIIRTTLIKQLKWLAGKTGKRRTAVHCKWSTLVAQYSPIYDLRSSCLSQ